MYMLHYFCIYLLVDLQLKLNQSLKDVRAHCYCASLMRTLCMTWCVPRHVFQVHTLSRKSAKDRAKTKSKQEKTVLRKVCSIS